MDCYYAHKGDLDRSEYERQQQAKKAGKSTTSSSSSLPEGSTTADAPKREPKRWGVIKPVTPIKMFSDEQFPAFGERGEEELKEEAALYHNPEIKAIFTAPKPREVSVEATTEPTMSDDDQEEGETEVAQEEVLTSAPAPAPTVSSRVHVSGSSLLVTSGFNGDGEGSGAADTADVDGGEWISSSTLSSFETNLHMEQKNVEEEENRDGKVACCTGDFSMQNVIIQMNMGLLSYENKRITSLRVYTRRCRDCFR